MPPARALRYWPFLVGPACVTAVPVYRPVYRRFLDGPFLVGLFLDGLTVPAGHRMLGGPPPMAVVAPRQPAGAMGTVRCGGAFPASRAGGKLVGGNALCSLRRMRRLVRRRSPNLARLLVAVSTLAAVLVLSGPGAIPVPVVLGATPALAQTPTGKSATEPASRGEKDVGPGSGKEENRRQFPLDLEQPHDILGLGILVIAGLAGALALGNAVKVLRGERPRATGKWRPR